MVVPGDIFPNCSSPHTAAPDSACSQCPGERWPWASSQPHCHFVQAGTGDSLGKRCAQSLVGCSVPGGCSRALGGHLAGPFVAQGPPAISLPGSAKLVQPALPSPLAVPKRVGARRDFTAQCPQAKKHKTKVRIPPFQPGTGDPSESHGALLLRDAWSRNGWRELAWGWESSIAFSRGRKTCPAAGLAPQTPSSPSLGPVW